MKLKLNKIQREIYDTYCMNDSVYAECPRQSGKTTVLKQIAYNHLKSDEFVTYISTDKVMCDRFCGMMLKECKDLTPRQFSRLVCTIKCGETREDFPKGVTLLDEKWYEWRWKQPKKIVCLRTRIFPILKFTYKDLEGDIVKSLEERRLGYPEEFNCEFDSGYKNSKGAKHKE